MDPFLSEIRCVAFNFAPKNWTLCNGQIVQINQNQALFSLLGTTYGGDGIRTFALPNLQGRAPLHVGTGYVLGQTAGEYAHTLISQEMPTHNHFAQGIGATQNSTAPAGGLLANTQGNLTVYGPFANNAAMFPASVSMAGGSQPHSNQSPYLVMNWIIALQGIYPSRT